MKVLVLYHAGYTNTPTIEHYLTAFKRHSSHAIWYFNVDQEYDFPLEFSGYDAIFCNFCVTSAGVARLDPPAFMPRLIATLRRYRGIKVVAAQDEYDFTDSLKRFVLQIKADIIFTCVPQDCVRLIYDEPEFDSIQFETVQTAYLAEDLLEIDPADILPLADRQLPLGYRGRNLPYRLGDLGWHKSEVGARFKDACVAAGIRHDIEVAEDQRFIGDEWLRFVRSCRVMLGSPSGANVFDFDGSLHKQFTDQWATSNPAYEDVRDEISAHEVAGLDMGQVSARIYEAVAQRTALALVRGGYSGVLEPDEHYVPIETDYSNIESVLSRILDVPAMQSMTDRAYTHVIDNPRNRFSYMVGRFDTLIELRLLRLLRRRVRGCQRQRKHHVSVCNDARSLQVTSYPLGCDDYLVKRLIRLRCDYDALADSMKDIIKCASEGRLEVIAISDGAYHITKHSRRITDHATGMLR